MLQVWKLGLGGIAAGGTVKIGIDHCPGIEILEKMRDKLHLNFQSLTEGKDFTLRSRETGSRPRWTSTCWVSWNKSFAYLGPSFLFMKW